VATEQEDNTSNFEEFGTISSTVAETVRLLRASVVAKYNWNLTISFFHRDDILQTL